MPAEFFDSGQKSKCNRIDFTPGKTAEGFKIHGKSHIRAGFAGRSHKKMSLLASLLLIARGQIMINPKAHACGPRALAVFLKPGVDIVRTECGTDIDRFNSGCAHGGKINISLPFADVNATVRFSRRLHR